MIFLLFIYFSRFIRVRFLRQITAIFLILASSSSFAMDMPIYEFSIQAYSQNINDYLPSNSEDYSTSLLEKNYQKSQLKKFYNHYYSTDAQGLSPWSEQMVRFVLPKVKANELEILDDFSNQNKAQLDRHYGENFKEHDQGWWNRIKQNMDLNSLDSSDFKEENKAIAVSNTFARALPDLAPDFYHASLPGQGFPFDNLQESTLWAGTPLYVISTSQDKAWSLVLTPDAYFSWVKSSDLAYVSSEFINQWQQAAQKNLVAITKTETSIIDAQQQFQFSGYIGAVFPLVERKEGITSILIPVKNEHNNALIKTAFINSRAADLMPLTASKKNIVKIIRQLQNRPYGWGGAYFYNDCSQEMKSIFTPFGIWLPRNSAQQSKLNSGLDLLKATPNERINTLKTKGHPLMTLIYIGGHVMLYVGNKKMDTNEMEAISYQNVWGLSPKNKDKRYVIGQSLFLPILRYFPENPDINSQANATYFKLVYLDKLDSKMDSPQAFARSINTSLDSPQDFRD